MKKAKPGGGEKRKKKKGLEARWGCGVFRVCSWVPLLGAAPLVNEGTCAHCWRGVQHEMGMQASTASVPNVWAAGNSSAAHPGAWGARALQVLTVAQQLLQWPACGLLDEVLLPCPTFTTGTRHRGLGTP